MGRKNTVLIIVNRPHKPQMKVLKERLKQFIPEFVIKIVGQRSVPSPGDDPPHAVITYNKNRYKRGIVEKLIGYAENGGKVIALHHNISSMHLGSPRWLEWAGVEICKGENCKYPWGVLEGGNAYLINLAPGHFVTSNNIQYLSEAPSFPEMNTNNHIVTHNAGELITDGCKVPAIMIENTEYFINLVLKPNPPGGPKRRLLMGIYYEHTDGRKFYSANAVWMLRRGDGLLFYSMIGHRPSCFTSVYCRLIANMLKYTE